MWCFRDTENPNKSFVLVVNVEGAEIEEEGYKILFLFSEHKHLPNLFLET